MKRIVSFNLDVDPMPNVIREETLRVRRMRLAAKAVGRDPVKRKASCRKAQKKYYWAHHEKELARRKDYYQRTGK